MRKIASMNLDVVDHIINDDIEKLAEIVEHLSEKAQSAYIPSLEELEMHQDKDFAAILWDPKIGYLRKFANYTPELTELNMAFLVKIKDSIPEEIVKVAANNLTCAAVKFKLNIPEEISNYKSDKFVNNLIDLTAINKEAYLEKKASNKPAPVNKYFALQSSQKYPINTESELKKAASFFEKSYYKLSIDDKLEFINNVEKRAKELNTPLTKTTLEKFANLSKNLFNEEFYDHIQIRKSYLKENEQDLKDAYDELISRADELGPLKCAYVIEELDKTAGLNNNYNKGILDPMLTSLGEEKIAQRTIDEVSVTLEQLKNLDQGVLTAIVGNDVIKELKGEQGLDVLESLPKPIRSEILNLI